MDSPVTTTAHQASLYARQRGEESPATTRRFGFDGEGGELFGIYLKNIVLTLLTLGVYRFWAAVRVQRFEYQHTFVAGGRFDYHATGREKFLGFLKGLLFLVPLALVCFGVYFLGRASLGPDVASTAALYVFLLILALLRPLVMVGSLRFNLARTSWRNIRFRFRGGVAELYGIYLVDILLIMLTLGIYLPWHFVKVRAYQCRHARLGGYALAYTGRGGQLLGIHLLGSFLTYITLFLAAPWYAAWQHRYHWDHTSFQGGGFRSTLTGWKLFKTWFVCAVVVLVTVGLGFPWAFTRYKRVIYETTYFVGELDIESLRGSYDEEANAFLEGVGEAGEALANIGDLFGG